MKLSSVFLTTLVAGLMLAATNMGPLFELRQAWEERRRLIQYLYLSASAFIFVIAGFIVATIETALQFDAYGAIRWNTVFLCAAVFVALGGLFAFIARRRWPPRTQGMYHSTLALIEASRGV